ncbi:hypothetical protein [Desulfonema magnum]|uniref:Lyase domain-containing protein n=1 Tax=Desulfonema magnum TaxID=45655 RepID=A0A975BIE3_9BACT|nr:hypothetical protein [Desulfonema magnum]QTA85630.1 lyase domain-containing protein [Desulfonema magnum]
MADITLKDISLQAYGLTERVRGLRKAYFDAMPEICTERPRLLTDFHNEHNLFRNDRISILEKARAYRYVLRNRPLRLWHKTGVMKMFTRL